MSAADKHTSRLGSIQLIRFLSSLQKKVQYDRLTCRPVPKKRWESVVFNIYANSKGNVSSMSRCRALQNVRMGKQWSKLAGNCLLFIMFLSDNAERIMSVEPTILVVSEVPNTLAAESMLYSLKNSALWLKRGNIYSPNR